MSVDFTRPNLFRAVLYFVLLYLLFRYRVLFAPWAAPEVEHGAMMPIQEWLVGFLGRRPVWNEIAVFLLSITNALIVTRILSRNLIYLERTFTPLIIYPLAALGFYVSAQTPIVLAVSLLIVFALDSMIKSHRSEENFGHFLHASVALGVAPLLYAPTVVFVVLLPVGFILFRQNWRSVISAILGYVMPFLFYSYIRWGMGDDFSQTARQIAHIIVQPATEQLFAPGTEMWEYIPVGVFLLLAVLGLIFFPQSRTKTRRRALRGFSVFVWLLAVTLGMFALPARSADMMAILAVPLAALIPAAFNRQSGWLPNLLYLLMIWSVLLSNLFLIFPDLLP